MGKIVANLTRTVAILVGAPAVSLLAYDVIAIQPRIDQVEAILANAQRQDANPPVLVRRMIDANTGSPSSYATSMVVSRIYPNAGMARWHMRNFLWRLLLPMHVRKTGVYGLYATLAFNGTDQGLSSFANREFGKPLDQLTPTQAATTVAITFAPTYFAKNKQRLDRRAEFLLQKSNLSH